MKFYLGCHNPSWLWDTEKNIQIPLFVSHSTLKLRKNLKKSNTSWALDSGGFTEIKKHGEWTVSVEEFIDRTRRFKEEIGNLDFAAPMDWMCEPEQLQKTGLSVREHQRRTTENYITLKKKAPDIPWIPVLQGWLPEDYLRHRCMYEYVGIDLEAEPTVGIGTVCRRQTTSLAHDIIKMLQPIKLHGFGIKITGLQAVGHLLNSSDSMAWSFEARMAKKLLPECKKALEENPKSHKNCANCHKYALQWYDKVMNCIGKNPCHQKNFHLIPDTDRHLIEIINLMKADKNIRKILFDEWDPLRRMNVV